ncbi:MAG: ABC transporter permease [Defluviitaleaceae bacterium]|nr:ABC transporter permease [Defluviitaleaceae bacterium]
MASLIEFIGRQQDLILTRTAEHAAMVLTALAISIVTGIIIGYLITYNKHVAKAVIYVCGMIMTIPSLALFVFFIPILGLGPRPAIAGLILYTLLPIVRNVYVGITSIDPAVIMAARGMGMTEAAITLKVKIPLALPVAFAGIRTAVVMGIGLGAIAAFVAAGGLGVFIFQGIQRGNTNMVLVGALFTTVLAVTVDKLMQLVQRQTEKMVE